jgi:hypothetical protein
MQTLVWIGKAAVVNHHRKLGYHLLRCDRELSAGGNALTHDVAADLPAGAEVFAPLRHHVSAGSL